MKKILLSCAVAVLFCCCSSSKRTARTNAYANSLNGATADSIKITQPKQ